MERKARLIAVLAGAALMALLAACGIDGEPITPQDNTLPAPGLDISPTDGSSIGPDDELYGLSV
ncbi:argininosuccinate lyase [Pseudooceanicola algae]|uniref:Lipoprotein n=1 Tax=Pseudooceanicola algae TaxID=1537215 RepID=A0A418SKL2_9RHOB|nr:argininosuccinate lyase [Pseudooceanicola algae]QPM90687.1 hypothetical protein PSAL_019260 [Pseudooceanicola algae]